jgi:hypothetical protein
MTLASVLCPEGHLLAANEHSYSSAWSYKTGKRIESSFGADKNKKLTTHQRLNHPNFLRALRARKEEGGEEGGKEGGKKKKKKKRRKIKITLRSVPRSI